MGQRNGFEKANRITDTIIRSIDRSGTAQVIEPRDIEGAGIIGVYRGRLFDDRYTFRGDDKRIYTPKKEG